METWDERRRERARRLTVQVRVVSGSVAGLVLSAFPVYYSILIPLTVAEWVLYLAIALAGAILVAEVAERLMRRLL